MKIILFLVFIFNSFVFSDELLTYQKNNRTYSYCIKEYYIYYNRIYFKKSSNNRYSYESLNRVKNYSLKSGYIYNGTCEKNYLNTTIFNTYSTKDLNHTNLSILGLSNEDLNLMFAFSGLMTSFLFLFGLFRWI